MPRRMLNNFRAIFGYCAFICLMIVLSPADDAAVAPARILGAVACATFVHTFFIKVVD
jgi:hypothetical protein